MNNKCVLISVRPQWCEKIASKEKTLEIRKTRPKLETPFKCYIYCTQGEEKWLVGIIGKHPSEKLNGKVIGEFVCDNITEFRSPAEWAMKPWDYSFACLKQKDIEDYAGGKTIYGWHISALQIYGKPRELSAFRKAYQMDSEGFIKCDHNPCDYVGEDGHYLYQCESNCPHLADKYKLTRPFQSWGYVEDIG